MHIGQDKICRQTQLQTIKDWTMSVCTLDKIKYEGRHNCKLYRLDYVCVYIGQDKIGRQTQLQTIKAWTISVYIRTR